MIVCDFQVFLSDFFHLVWKRASFKITSSSCSNDAAQSDDEEKLQSQPTDTDGGKLKQKT